MDSAIAKSRLLGGFEIALHPQTIQHANINWFSRQRGKRWVIAPQTNSSREAPERSRALRLELVGVQQRPRCLRVPATWSLQLSRLSCWFYCCGGFWCGQ